MEEIFEHIINDSYQYFHHKILGKFGSSHVRFGDFQLSYNWAGRTRLSKELLGNLVIYCRSIHLISTFYINYPVYYHHEKNILLQS